MAKDHESPEESSVVFTFLLRTHPGTEDAIEAIIASFWLNGKLAQPPQSCIYMFTDTKKVRRFDLLTRDMNLIESLRPWLPAPDCKQP